MRSDPTDGGAWRRKRTTKHTYLDLREGGTHPNTAQAESRVEHAPRHGWTSGWEGHTAAESVLLPMPLRQLCTKNGDEPIPSPEQRAQSSDTLPALHASQCSHDPARRAELARLEKQHERAETRHARQRTHVRAHPRAHCVVIRWRSCECGEQCTEERRLERALEQRRERARRNLLHLVSWGRKDEIGRVLTVRSVQRL
jgi:hypothetical protein